MFIRKTFDFINNNLDETKGISELEKLEKFILDNEFKYSNYDLTILLKNEKIKKILKNIDTDYLNLDKIGKICIAIIEIYKAGGKIVEDPQKEILIKIQAGDKKARKQFIVDNQRLVMKIAKKYSEYGVDFEDLVQEGNFGLMRTIEKFDINKGYRFSTYAIHWIKSTISSYVFTNSKTITVPRHLENKVSTYKKIREQFMNKYDREPTIVELSKLMDQPISEVEFIIQTQKSITSLDAPVGEDADTNLVELIDSGTETPEEILYKKGLKKEFEYILAKSNILTEREYIVIYYRFGFDGRVKTLEEVGEILKITRERVRQIENKALRKLRRSMQVSKLYDYSDNPEEAKKFINDIRKYKY